MTDTQPPIDADDADDAATEPAAAARGRRLGRTAAPAAASTDIASREAADELPWVDDRASKVWVVLIVAVFAAILLYGVLFGRAGMLSPAPSPSPSPSPSQLVTPSPSAPPAASPSPRPSVSPAASPASAPPGGSPSVSPSPAAS